MVRNKTKRLASISCFLAYMSEENLQKHVILNKLIALGYNVTKVCYLNISAAYQ